MSRGSPQTGSAPHRLINLPLEVDGMTLPAFPHRPGSMIQRYSRRESYNPDQWARWLTVDDAYYALANGYAETRRPSPAKGRMEQERYEEWQERMTAAWQSESSRLRGSAAVKAEDMPENLRLYLFERLCAIA